MTTTQPSYEELLAKCTAHEHEISYLKQQIDWFRKQLFGRKSGREIPASPNQLVLFPDMTSGQEEEKVRNVAAHTRKKSHVGNKIAIPLQIFLLKSRSLIFLKKKKYAKRLESPLLK
jgi:hypothetical protein